ncbi:MAG: hypothetical protein IT464_06710 [Planctomycetes bacterium]|nr:hypothetical protein [Planctomycetota bacterium]
MPEDSIEDPELGFGEEELVAEPMALPVHDVTIEDDSDADPVTLAEDANVPLDVEPDADLPDGEVFTDHAPEVAAEHDASDKHKLELQALRAELQGLRDERSRLVTAKRQLEERLESAAPAGELTRLEAALSEAKEHRRRAEEQASALRRDVAELQDRLAQAAEAAAQTQPQGEKAHDAAAGLDLMDAQISALQSENTRLKEALQEAQGAESRAELAHDELGRRVEELNARLKATEEKAESAAEEAEALARKNEELGRELALSRKAVADTRDASATLERDTKELDDRKAEVAQITKALADALAEIERLKPFEKEAQRVEALEDRITELQEKVLAREKDAAEAQEKLDTEAARSYRLSQRRIPALNKEIEDSQEHTRELERKLQKAELKANTFEEQVKELQGKLSDLERALHGAKARAQDTAIIQPQDADASAMVSDEVRRLTNRMREVETERAKLADSVRRLDDAQRAELKRLSDRADRLEAESDERFDNLLKQRTQLRILRERLNGMLRLAEDLGKADRDMGKTLLDAIRKLADVPPDAN